MIDSARYAHDPDAFEDAYPRDDADLFDGAEYDAPFACDSPRGHAPVTSCGFTKCVYCGLVFWS